MGGGVSLGTFCGTALSQALKLLIVHGGYTVGNRFVRFDRIEVDVFSGASAGALSLAAMLRCLASVDPQLLASVQSDVEAEFGERFGELSEDQQLDLCAAEVMQRFQAQLWSQEIKLESLLGEGGDGDLPFKGSLLDRGAVDSIARRYIVDGANSADFSHRRVLAERVLFASTLTNLTPVIEDAQASFPGREVGFIGLNDGLRSSTHRDLRVFDLNFREIAEPASSLYPDRWCLYHAGPEQPRMVGSLNERGTWARMAATAIASGAFPGAFEPVVLPRKAFEFGPTRWRKIKGLPATTDFDGSESLPFSYVDGGTLNNEPIREAFRLASYIDGHARAALTGDESQRLIVFVDPNVSPTRPSFRVPGHGAWLPIEPGKLALRDAPAVRRAPSFQRLLPYLVSVAGAITDESGTIEADKINAVHNQFAERDGIRQALFNTLTRQPKNEELLTLMAFIESRLAESEQDDIIPPGPMTLPGELERVCHEEIEADPRSPFAPLRGHAKEFAAQMIASGKVQHKDLWLRLLAFVAVDILLRLEGKLQNASLVAIAPFRNLAAVDAGQAPEPVWLPGGALSGFAGFMSDLPDRIEHAAARYCAAEFLRACGLIDPATPLPDPAGFMLEGERKEAFQKALARDIENGLAKLGGRVAAMLRDADLVNILPGLDSLITAALSHFIKSKIKGIDWRTKQEQVCTFRVAVPNEQFEFDGEKRDVDARPVKNPASGDWEIVTLASWDWQSETWTGTYVKAGQLDIDQSGTGFSGDTDFCTIKLPGAAMMREQEFLPNPTFYLDLRNSRPTDESLDERSWLPQPGVTLLEEQLTNPILRNGQATAEVGSKLVAAVIARALSPTGG